jgi:hypothetical protein
VTCRIDQNGTVPYADDLKNLGKKFAITQEPWLKLSIFCVPLVITANNDPAARFIDDESYDQGTITFLHEFVPSKSHNDMGNLSDFAKEASSSFISHNAMFTYVVQFCKHLSDERSTAIQSINKAASIIFNLPAHFVPRAYAHDKEPSLLQLLKSKDSKTYPIFAPMLYPEVKVELKLVFCTPIIIKVQAPHLNSVI